MGALWSFSQFFFFFLISNLKVYYKKKKKTWLEDHKVNVVISQFLFYLIVSFWILNFSVFELKVNVVIKDIYDETIASLNIHWGQIHMTRRSCQKIGSDLRF